jgi:hypothetical protein
MSNELKAYITKLRKRRMPELSREEAAVLIVEGGNITLDTNHPEELWKSSVRENLQKLRRECGWSYEELAKQVDLDKKLVIGHLKHGKGLHPETLKKYARAFSDWLERPISPDKLDD